MRNFCVNLLLLLFVLSFIEVGSYFAGTILRSKGVFYNAPKIDNYEQYLEDRHPTLGWPSKSHLTRFFDAEQSRPIPSFPDPSAPSCVSMYGDSFTWGDAVLPEDAIPNVLAKQLGCRVSNFGVAGYGTDQMLLRFTENTDDEAPIVVLNHFTGDIRRNVTRMRNLMAESNSQYILFKPRFVLNENKLELLGIPTPTTSEASCIAETPERCLEHDYFLPGGPSGVQHLTFPFTLSILKAFGNEHVRAKLSGESVWNFFYLPDHPSRALHITRAIINQFQHLARSRGKIPVVSITANAHDIEYFRTNGMWGYQPLIDALAEDGIHVVNTGPYLNGILGDRDVCAIGNESCYGHLTAEGYAAVATQLAKYIEDLPSWRTMIPPQEQSKGASDKD